jgi:hypothetical protein
MQSACKQRNTAVWCALYHRPIRSPSFLLHTFVQFSALHFLNAQLDFWFSRWWEFRSLRLFTLSHFTRSFRLFRLWLWCTLVLYVSPNVSEWHTLQMQAVCYHKTLADNKTTRCHKARMPQSVLSININNYCIFKRFNTYFIYKTNHFQE